MEEVTAYKSIDGLVFPQKILCVILELKYRVASKFLKDLEGLGYDFELTKEDYVKISDLVCDVIISNDSIIIEYTKGLTEDASKK